MTGPEVSGGKGQLVRTSAMLNKSMSVFTFHRSASAEKEYFEYSMFKESTVKQPKHNSQHKELRAIQALALPCFFRELFPHDNLSCEYSTLIVARGSFLLLWSCLIAHVQGVVEGRSYVHVASCFSVELLQGYKGKVAHRNTTHLLQIRDRFHC